MSMVIAAKPATDPKAIDVAQLFLTWANKDGDLITNLKMQKLLYYAQAWHLVNFDKPLFNDEIQAWKFGPVVRSVFNKFKEFGAAPIEYKKSGHEEAAFTKQQLEYLKEFYGVFIKFAAYELVSMSHSDSPWINANKKGASTPIDLGEMKSFYDHLYTTTAK